MAALSSFNTQQTSYIEMLENFRKRRNEWVQLYPAIDKLPALFPQLLTAQKCICVGAGLAQYDAEFITRCMPKIESLLVVEADPTCSEFLRKNLASMLRDGRKNKAGAESNPPPPVHTPGGLSYEPATSTLDGDKMAAKDGPVYGVKGASRDGNVENGGGISARVPKIEIYEGLVQDWSNSLDELTYARADVLVAFHVLVYLDADQRKKFFVDSFRRWLKPGGLAFILLMTDHEHTNLFQNIYRELRLPAHAEIGEIKDELRDLNFHVVHRQPLSCNIDLGDLDPSSLEFFQAMATEPRSKREILDAIEKVSDGGKGMYFSELIAVREKA